MINLRGAMTKIVLCRILEFFPGTDKMLYVVGVGWGDKLSFALELVSWEEIYFSRWPPSLTT